MYDDIFRIGLVALTHIRYRFTGTVRECYGPLFDESEPEEIEAARKLAVWFKELADSRRRRGWKDQPGVIGKYMFGQKGFDELPHVIRVPVLTRGFYKELCNGEAGQVSREVDAIFANTSRSKMAKS